MRLIIGGFAALLISATAAVQTSAVCFRFTVRSVVDSASIPGATIVLEPGGPGGGADVNGHLLLCPSGRVEYSWSVSAIGYQTAHGQAAGKSDRDTIAVTLFLLPETARGDSVTVFAERLHRQDDWTGQLTGRDIEVKREASVAETLDELPGFAVQSMGPNTGQVVARGFSGDRVTVALDGLGTPDASTTGADHAVTISPALAGSISILYGPESFLYSSTPVGGVIDVETGFERRSRELSGFATLRYGTGADETDASGVLSWKPSAMSEIGIYSVYRNNGDQFLSDGTSLPGSDGSVAQAGGTIGTQVGPVSGTGSYDYYDSEYGIPPDPTGPHSEGVRIDIRKHSGRFGIMIDPVPADDSLAASSSVGLDIITSDYVHREVEADGVIGVEYGIAQTGGALAFEDESGTDEGRRTVLRAGYNYSNVTANGLRLSPSSGHRTNVVAFRTERFGAWGVNGSVRFDWSKAIEERQGTTTVRDHIGFSGGIGVVRDLFSGMTAGVSLHSSFRPPEIRELFSRGPHAANRSYEVGNRDLRNERGYGMDAFLHVSVSDADAEIRVFGTEFTSYLIPVPTGDTNRASALPIYQLQDEGARVYGFEVDLEVPFGKLLRFHGSGEYVLGEVTQSGQPLPRMPPATMRLALEHRSQQWLATVYALGRAEQNRTGPFEASTPGSILAGCNLQYRSFVGKTIHTVTLNAGNVLQTEWHDHLSKLRDVYPGAGRSVTLSYRVDF